LPPGHAANGTGALALVQDSARPVRGVAPAPELPEALLPDALPPAAPPLEELPLDALLPDAPPLEPELAPLSDAPLELALEPACDDPLLLLLATATAAGPATTACERVQGSVL
jgi:hypothetical protein